MRPLLLAGLGLLLAGAPQALAQDCTGGVVLTETQVRQLLVSRHASGPAGQAMRWNVGHGVAPAGAGGFTDFKRGPNDPRDPTRVMGSFSIGSTTNPTAGGSVSYSYSTGGTFAYQIRATTDPGQLPLAGTYSFCGISGAQNFLMNVCDGPCPVQ